jgi:hypothetical protein
MKYTLFLSLTLSLLLLQCKSNDVSENGKKEDIDSIPEVVIDSTQPIVTDGIEQVDIIPFDTIRFVLNDTTNIELKTYFNTGKLWKVNEKDSLLTVNIKDIIKRVDGKTQDFQIFSVTTQKKGQFTMEVENKRPFGKQEGERNIKRYLFIIE